MSFINREVERIQALLRQGESVEKYSELYAAQQALSWASDPEMFKSPYDLVMGIQEDLEGCLAVPHQPQS